MSCNTLVPQPGPQTMAMTNDADVLVMGGQAGGGKSWFLLAEPLRYVMRYPKFRGILFRKTLKDIKKAGGLWDKAMDMYVSAGAIPNKSEHTFTWPNGARIELAGLQYEDDKYSYKGSEYDYVGWDEVTDFSETQVMYLLSRMRTLSPRFRPYMRMTCNPDASHFIATWLKWWIHPETGYPIQDRSGVQRFFSGADNFKQYDNREDAPNYLQKHLKTITFVPSSLYDNKILMESDPAYEGNLLAQTDVERERLLGGNWFAIDDSDSQWPKEHFQGAWIEEEDVPWNKIHKVNICVDPSMGKSDKKGDYSAIVAAMATEELIYVEADLDRRSPSVLIDDIIRFVEDLHHRFRENGVNNFVPLIGIESVAFQELLIDQLTAKLNQNRDTYLYRYVQSGGEIYPVPTHGHSKLLRIRRLSKHITEHHFRFVKGKFGTTLTVQQLQKFPNADHDDGCDGLEMCMRLEMEAESQ